LIIECCDHRLIVLGGFLNRLVNVNTSAIVRFDPDLAAPADDRILSISARP